MFLQKIKSHKLLQRCIGIFGLAVLVGFNVAGMVNAQSVTRGYGSDDTLQRGMIVGIKKSDTTKVEPIDSTRLSSILGVVVNPNDSPITVSNSGQNIFVVTSGRYDVLVSDQQGTISPTDYITVSSISGIGMKATDEQDYILGRAASGFDGKTNVLSSTVLTTSNGGNRTVKLSRIKVDIAVDKNPLGRLDTRAPAILNRLGTSIAGKTVKPLRLYLSAAVFIVGMVTAGSMLYAGIRSSIIAIGRNPLSRKSIFRSMIGVSFSSLIVFVISIIGVYLLLKI